MQVPIVIFKDESRKFLRITFDESDLDLLFKVRTIPQIKYFPADKEWIAPASSAILEDLKNFGFFMDEETEKLSADLTHEKELIMNEASVSLKGELFPFQKEGVAFADQHGGRVLIADEMGLGKTVQALAWLNLHRDRRPAIIVVPASLKLDWKQKAEEWMENPKTEVLFGTKARQVEGEIIIINYDILYAWVEKLKELNPQVLIMDESHYIKSNATKRTKAIKKLAKGIPYVIALSGTPILNRPIEIYNTLRVVKPDLFPSQSEFAKRYCGLKYGPFGWDFSGATHIPELHHILINTIMIRRLKKDVLTQLPDKLYSFVPIQLSNRGEYNEAERDFIAFIRKEKGVSAAIRAKAAEALTKASTLKQLAIKGKLRDSIEWIEDFLEVEQKLVVFCDHRFVVDELMERFGDIAVKIDGSVSAIERQKAKEAFQNDPKVKLFVGNIKAASEGITLTASSNVAFLEYPWSPGLLVQCADRCHRIGQKDNVTVHYLFATNTIDEKIARLLDKKKAVLAGVLDGGEMDQSSLLIEIMKSYEQ